MIKPYRCPRQHSNNNSKIYNFQCGSIPTFKGRLFLMTYDISWRSTPLVEQYTNSHHYITTDIIEIFDVFSIIFSTQLYFRAHNSKNKSKGNTQMRSIFSIICKPRVIEDHNVHNKFPWKGWTEHGKKNGQGKEEGEL